MNYSSQQDKFTRKELAVYLTLILVIGIAYLLPSRIPYFDTDILASAIAPNIPERLPSAGGTINSSIDPVMMGEAI